jgi:hypothetical protein
MRGFPFVLGGFCDFEMGSFGNFCFNREGTRIRTNEALMCRPVDLFHVLCLPPFLALFVAGVSK